jgi:hypothetical protein
VLTENAFDIAKKNALIDNIYDVELKYLQAVTAFIIDRQTWENSEIMPLHRNVTKEGFAI